MDFPASPLPAGSACVYSFLDLEGGKIGGSRSYFPQSPSRIRSSGAPGLLLLGSRTEPFHPRLVGGIGSFSTCGLNRNSMVPAGNGGPGILMDGKSLALLDGGAVRGGIRGQRQIHPFAALHVGPSGPGPDVRKDSLARSRGSKVGGGRYRPAPPGPVWAGKGGFKVFKGPVKRPAPGWVRDPPSPARASFIFALRRGAWFCSSLPPPAGLGIAGSWFLRAVRFPEGKRTVTSDPVVVVFWP